MYTTKLEKLDTPNKTVATLIQALAVFELLSLEIADTVHLRLPTEPSFTTTRGLWG